MGAPDIPSALSAEEEMLFAFHGILQDLISRWQEYDLGEEMDVLIKVIDRLCRSKQLSFSGEPLQGLQVMGLLETRALDFDRIILLSANEDILPSGKPLNTFIPYDWRDQVKLPPTSPGTGFATISIAPAAEHHGLFLRYRPMNLGGGERSRFLCQ
jgi:inactivated superfamily I helicase